LAALGSSIPLHSQQGLFAVRSSISLAVMAAGLLALSTETQATVRSFCLGFGLPCECPWHVRDCIPTCRIQPYLECAPTQSALPESG
jgi:hypothetical protein